MAERSNITPKVVRELLRYEADTGLLFWLERPQVFFPDNAASHAWNAKYAGKEALISTHNNDYRIGNILKFRFLAHRVAFAIYYGRWPNGEVDHIDGNRTNNRIKNLREVSHAENQRNMKRFSSNTSGVTGVSWHKRDKIWRAHIRSEGKAIHLGSFTSKDEAIEARRAFSKKVGYSARHGQ